MQRFEDTRGFSNVKVHEYKTQKCLIDIYVWKYEEFLNFKNIKIQIYENIEIFSLFFSFSSFENWNIENI